MRKQYIELNQNFLSKPIAHRGLHSSTVSENSMESFRLAIEKGYPIEIDIHLMRDGEIAVIHDSNLQRVTGIDAIIEDLTSEELIHYPLLLSGEKIPTFKEFLALVNGQVPVLIEIKATDTFNPELCDKLLIDLKSYPYADKVALQSFNPFVVKYLKKRSSLYSVGLLATANYRFFGKFKNYLLRTLKLYNYIKADFVSYNIDALPNIYVSKKVKKGHKLLAWTINTPEKLNKARKIANNIIFEKIEV